MPEYPPQLILFDCDGTLVDSDAHITRSMQRAFADNGLDEPTESDIRSLIGMSLHDAVECLFADLYPAEVGKLEAVVASFRRHYAADEHELKLYDGVRETLDELVAHGYWLGIVTGKSMAGLKRVLALHDLSDHFFVLRTADCCPSKPHPAMVNECMQEMGVKPAQTTVVGDALFDIEMAKNSDVRALGVGYGVMPGSRLLAAGAESVVGAFPELLAHFPPLRNEAASPTM